MACIASSDMPKNSLSLSLANSNRKRVYPKKHQHDRTGKSVRLELLIFFTIKDQKHDRKGNKGLDRLDRKGFIS